jgi:type IV secretory pathway TraG/TraD family ATPase VirD4
VIEPLLDPAARRPQQHADGLLSPGRSSIGTETVPTYRPGDVRTLDRGRVLVLHRSLRPILARTIDVSDRRDWTVLRADVDAVRAGRPPVDPAGYADPPADQPSGRRFPAPVGG